MQLRDHPSMTRKHGGKIWPPYWVSITDKDTQALGEIGILQEVSQNQSLDCGLFLWIEHQGKRYVGLLLFDDEEFCRGIRKVLESKIGVSIREIGDIDLLFTL